MAQTPNFIFASPGETVTIACRPSKTVYYEEGKFHAFAWYHQKPGQSPALIIYKAIHRNTGVPDRFSSTVSGPDVILKIVNIETQDAGDYYCLQHIEHPLTQ
uniref:Ig-like domain-containing protein n=1 Tax=Pyxicephalus adspersus TaxID=30357 RepID=A0AAV3B2D1_PYXAD|nr:TPA: hypothetical protein GDO54_009684 [Pyxicephalus adspersus]